MGNADKSTEQTGMVDRMRRYWVAPVAVLGVFAAFAGALFRSGLAPKPAGNKPALPASPPRSASAQVGVPPTPVKLEREYVRTAILGGAGSSHPFRRSLNGVAVGSGDRIYLLGDGEVRIFEADGVFSGAWKAPERACCIHVAPEGTVYLGAQERVALYDLKGNPMGGFAAGESGSPASITSIKVVRNEILVADSAARFIRRYDAQGRELGRIGTQHKTGGFMLPNGWLDFDADSRGVIHATDSGRHQVTSWAMDGSPIGRFGKFGMSHPADFVGCCNPVNLAVAPDGEIVTGEKMVARVKVYERGGKLVALIGAENFDPMCTHIHLAVDSKRRILAGDPVRREVLIFSPLGQRA